MLMFLLCFKAPHAFLQLFVFILHPENEHITVLFFANACNKTIFSLMKNEPFWENAITNA